MLKKKTPNFLLVGAAKSGTTSLFNYLNEHPEVYIPEKKECKFFSDMSIDVSGPDKEYFIKQKTKTFDEYKNLFKKVTVFHKAIGDVSNDYLFYYELSIKNIIQYLGRDVRIIIVLRNPIDRAFSHYYGSFRANKEVEDTFEKAIKKNEYRKKNNWPWYWAYLDVGLYYYQVKAYVDNFNHLRIYLFDDLIADPLKMVKDIYRFLKINEDFTPKIQIHNKSGRPKNKNIHEALTKSDFSRSAKTLLTKFRLKKYGKTLKNYLVEKNLEKETMREETRKKLRVFYKEDIEKLSVLINRDLSCWLK